MNPLNSNYKRMVGEYPSFSQAGQDLFVRAMLNFKLHGIYVDIGGSDPIVASNTFILEDSYCWKGVSFDIDPVMVGLFRESRKNACILADATIFDYAEYFKANEYPRQLDYLSIDIDPAEATYKALLRLPLQEYRFSVITYEHDNYTTGPRMMNESRKYLHELGYQRVISNVLTRGRDFEDWYVDPTVIGRSIFEPYLAQNIESLDFLSQNLLK